MSSPLGYNNGGRQSYGSRPEGRSGSYEDEQPKPYDFSYQTTDELGNQQSRVESSDGSGNVKGSYGYTNVDGLGRQLTYMADDSGFRAVIKTNEPGTDNKNPADVQIQADPSVNKQRGSRSGYQQQLRSSSFQSGERKSRGYGQMGSGGCNHARGGYQQQQSSGYSTQPQTQHAVPLRTYMKSVHQ